MKKSIFRLILTSVLMTQVTACGFQLRGYKSEITHNIPDTQLVFGASQEDYAVKNALKQQFSQFAITTQDAHPNEKASNMASIEVKNIKLQTYQLRGILTEIRMVMSADVTYQVLQNGTPKVVKNTVQVQRSYQYDQADVATDNPQADQIKIWLYDNLAERIADQYMALNMPKNSGNSSTMVKP